MLERATDIDSKINFQFNSLCEPPKELLLLNIKTATSAAGLEPHRPIYQISSTEEASASAPTVKPSDKWVPTIGLC